MEVWKTLVGAFGYVVEYKKPLSKSLVVPLLIMVMIGYFEPDAKSFDWALFFLITAAEILLYTIIAITTHRIILLGPSSVPEWGMYKFTGRELSFIIYSLGIGILMIPAGILSLIPMIGYPVALLGIAYILGRLSLIFPAIATDRLWTLSKSWQASKNNQLLMMVVAFIFPAILTLPEYVLEHMAYEPYTSMVSNVFSSLAMILVIAALSTAFKLITEEGKENGHTTTPNI